ncbi:hypothetical protein CLF_112969, partial [Clonorchis sinensis]
MKYRKRKRSQCLFTAHAAGLGLPCLYQAPRKIPLRIQNNNFCRVKVIDSCSLSTNENAATWTKVDKELSLLNEYLTLSTPGPLVVKKFIQLYEAAIKFATASLVDRHLATLITGDSDVHASAKEGRLQPNKPYTIRQIRKLLAGFKATKQAQIRFNSLNNSKSGLPKGVIERATSKSGRNFRPREKTSSATAALTEVVQQSAWTQHVVAPTRYRAGQQPSLLDLVITNERHFVDQVTINAPLGHSDHCVLTCDFICYWARNPEPQTWIRNFCRADFSGMRIFLNQVKLGPASVEDLYRTIVQEVHEADAMYVPKKNQHAVGRAVNYSKESGVFWKRGDTEDELAFRKMRNRCKSELRQWNIRKQATILDIAQKNRNVLFKYMRHCPRNKPSAFSLKDWNGEPTSDPIVVSELYSDHYAGLCSVPASSSHPSLSKRNYERSLTDLGFTVEKIRQLLHKVNPFRALGPDEVHPRILKKTSYTLVGSLIWKRNVNQLRPIECPSSKAEEPLLDLNLLPETFDLTRPAPIATLSHVRLRQIHCCNRDAVPVALEKEWNLIRVDNPTLNGQKG